VNRSLSSVTVALILMSSVFVMVPIIPANGVVASITVSPSSGVVSTSVTITGAGLIASHSLTVTYDGSGTGMPTSCSTNSTGGINSGCTFMVPLSVSGPHTVGVADGTNSATATFTVISYIFVTPGSGKVGSTVNIWGVGFLASSILTLTFDGSSASMPACSTDPSGSINFGCAFVVPSSAPGPHTIAVTDGTNSLSARFTVLASDIFTVTITESGLPTLTVWQVTFNGTSSEGNYNSVSFGDIPNGQYSFTVGSVAGYTASPSSGTISVSGADVTQVITFVKASLPASAGERVGLWHYPC